MGQLNRRHRALRLEEPGQPAQGLAVRVRPDPETAVGDAPACLHARGLHEHRTRPTEGELAEMGQMPVTGHSVLGGVGAHRRDHDAVGQLHATQAQWREESAGIGGHWVLTVRSWPARS